MESLMFRRTRLISWYILVIPFLLTYIHRVALNVIADQLMNEFLLTATILGNLAAVYSIIYLIMQIPGGALVDLWGPKRIGSIAALFLGLGSLLFAISNSLYMLFISRFLIGLGGSVVLINVFKFQANWFKESQFGIMTGMAIFIGNIGAIIATLPLAYWVSFYGWRLPFIIIALISFIVVILCQLLVKNEPVQTRYEKNEITVTKKKLIEIKNDAFTVLKNRLIWQAFFAGRLSWNFYCFYRCMGHTIFNADLWLDKRSSKYLYACICIRADDRFC